MDQKPLSSSSSSAEEDEPQPSTSRSAVEEEPQPSTSRSAVEDDAPTAKRYLYAEEIRGMWNLVKVYRQLGTCEQAVAFAEERGMIPRQKICNYHKQQMLIQYSWNKTVGSFVCNRGPCRAKTKVSRGKGTWFENTKIPMPRVFYLMYAFAEKFSYDRTVKEDFSEGELCLSRSTISDWFNYCREAVATYQKNKETVKGKIGGPGKVVQIGESQFGKKKYNIGCRVEGHWILGMIQDGSEDLRLEVCPDNVRSAEVLVPLIKKHVAEGTTIHTKFWWANDCLGDHGYIYHKVNHSDENNSFAAEDGNSSECGYTRRFESQWRVIKQFFYKDNYTNRTNINNLIYEYLWRREVQRDRKDPFEELINVINYVYHE